MYHAESLNTGYRTAGAAFTDESLRMGAPGGVQGGGVQGGGFRGGGGSGGGLPPPAKYCTSTVLVLTSCLILGTGRL